MAFFNLFKATKNQEDFGSYSFNETNDNPSRQAIIYKSELDFISKCILDYPNIETGGQLFGFWTSTGTPIVAYAIGPGKNAQHRYTSFIQDQDYPDIIGKRLYKKYRLQHIGEWHSHHQLGLAEPSGGDINAFVYGLRNPRFPRLLLCIGNCTETQSTINAFNFHNHNPHNYAHAYWDIVEAESPFRKIADQDLSDILIMPRTKIASHGQLHTINQPTTSEEPAVKTHWLTSSIENVNMMKAFVKDVKNLVPETYKVKTEILSSGEPVINVNDTFMIILSYEFPQLPPLLKAIGIPENLKTTLAEQEETIAETWKTSDGSLRDNFNYWLNKTLSMCITKEEQFAQSVKTLESNSNRNSSSDSTIAKCDLNNRIEAEFQVLDHYFTKNTIHYDTSHDNMKIYFLVNNPYKMCLTAIKILVSPQYPVKTPEVFIGYHDKIENFHTLSEYISDITFTSLFNIIPNSEELYEKLLNKNSGITLIKVFSIVCILIEAMEKAFLENKYIQDYVDPLIASEEELEKKLQTIYNSIKQIKI